MRLHVLSNFFYKTLRLRDLAALAARWCRSEFLTSQPLKWLWKSNLPWFQFQLKIIAFGCADTFAKKIFFQKDLTHGYIWGTLYWKRIQSSIVIICNIVRTETNMLSNDANCSFLGIYPWRQTASSHELHDVGWLGLQSNSGSIKAWLVWL